MRFLTYNPEQAYLLPPSVREVLGEDHICFFVHQVVERLELSAFEQGYVEQGRPAYHPVLLLKVWLYAYALGVTSARRLEQRVREDLAFRYLAGGATPDFWTLNQFRMRHARALNDLFTQVVELARSLGMGRLGHVAIDSTRVAANASRDRVETVKKLRAERAKVRRQIRRWQKQCNAADPDEAPGQQVAPEKMAALEKRLEEIPRRLERLRKSGLKRRSETDPDSRFLRDRKGFTLGYTADLAVSEDHLIVEQRVTQNATDHRSLVPLVEAVEQRCGERPQKVSADSGFFKLKPIVELVQRGIDVYVPDSVQARELNRGKRVVGAAPVRHPEHRRMRQKLRDPAGRAIYQRRKAIVEPLFGVLKEQRGMRQFRRRGLAKVAVELALAATAFNLTRLWRTKPTLDRAG
jgi:transposase